MPKPIAIDDSLIAHLGELARIDVPADRRAAVRDQLQRLVDAFSALSEADLGSNPGESDANPLAPERLRADADEAPPAVGDVLANAPQTAADCFVVPRVVDA